MKNHLPVRELEALAWRVRNETIPARQAGPEDSALLAAALAQRLASREVDCEIVHGTVMGQPHSWVRLEAFGNGMWVDSARDRFASEPGVDDPAHYLDRPVVVQFGMMVTPGRTSAFEKPPAGQPGESLAADDPRRHPSFLERFGRSVVVDALGRPLRVHHGSPHDFERFDPEKVKVSDPDAPVGGFWFAAHEDAANYGRHVKPFYLCMNNPARYCDAARAYQEVLQRGDVPDTKTVQAELADRGFDGYLHDPLRTYTAPEIARWKRFLEMGEAVEYRPGKVAKLESVADGGGVSLYDYAEDGEHHVTGYLDLEELLDFDARESGIFVAFHPDQIIPAASLRRDVAAEVESSVSPYVSSPEPTVERETLYV